MSDILVTPNPLLRPLKVKKETKDLLVYVIFYIVTVNLNYVFQIRHCQCGFQYDDVLAILHFFG